MRAAPQRQRARCDEGAAVDTVHGVLSFMVSVIWHRWSTGSIPFPHHGGAVAAAYEVDQRLCGRRLLRAGGDAAAYTV